jgi:ankyrin repeat protein
LVENLTNKEDINIKNINGNTCLHIASQFGNLQILKLLIENGSNFNLKNNYGFTCLHFACKYTNNLELIKYLIEIGCNMNEKNEDDHTPLWYSKRYSRNEITEFLLKNGEKHNKILGEKKEK